MTQLEISGPAGAVTAYFVACAPSVKLDWLHIINDWLVFWNIACQACDAASLDGDSLGVGLIGEPFTAS